jgi:tRNA dimethylallyltransferase
VPAAGPIPLLAIVGPTGVGKTRLAVALAAEWPIEVVSVDSRQVYRRMDVGTGKPTAAERRAVRHHLVDIVEPDEPYDAARFARDAAAAIEDIATRGHWPVLVGGTGLYYRALLRGLLPRPAADRGLRARLRAEAEAGGLPELHRRLADLDPGTAARVHPRDAVRVTRALEVVLQTGGPIGQSGPGSWSEPPAAARYRAVTVGLTMERPALYAVLDARVERMLQEGLVEEVRTLLDTGVAPELPAMQGIGYRHLVPVVRRGTALPGAVGAMKRDTRRYAKRQWTWFGREPGLVWVAVRPGAAVDAAPTIKRIVDRTRLFEYPE